MPRHRLLILLCLAPVCASAQTGFVARYQARVASTLVNQQHWATPLVTVNARIEQGFRSDFVRQTATSGQKTWNSGNSKGLQFIPLPRLEIRLSPPPFLALLSLPHLPPHLPSARPVPRTSFSRSQNLSSCSRILRFVLMCSALAAVTPEIDHGIDA